MSLNQHCLCVREKVGSIFIRNDNCTGKVWERGAVTESHKGTGTEAESAPGKGRVGHQCGSRRSGCGLSLKTGLTGQRTQ